MVKYLTILYFLFVFVCPHSFSQNCEDNVEWLYPKPQGLGLLDIEFQDSLTGYASGFNIIKTTNGGKDWVALDIPKGVFLIEILDHDNVLAFETTSGKIYQTVDGGTNWNAFSDIGQTIHEVEFIEKDYGIMSVGDSLLKSADGGKTWKILSNLNHPVRQFQFFNKMEGFVFRSDSSCYTSNGGKIWRKRIINLGKYNIPQTFFWLDSLNGFIGTGRSFYSGELFRTSDGGKSWIKADGAFGNFRKIFFLNKEVGFSSTYGDNNDISVYFFKTTNGGFTWTEIRSNEPKPMNKFLFVNSSKGFAVGESGKIMTTNNQGQSWSDNLPITHLDEGFVLNDSIAFLASCRYVFRGGSFGKMAKYSLNSNAAELLLDECTNNVFFFDEEKGYGYGWSPGISFTTTDGGKSWQYLKNNNLQLISNLFYPISKDTIFTSAENKLFRSPDGGISFNELPIESSAELKTICFVNSKIGYVVNLNGKVFRTTNGGDKWNSVGSVPIFEEIDNIHISSLQFVTPLNGFISFTFIKDNFRTTDGGITWQRMKRGGYFKDQYNGISTLNDTLWYTTDGGETWELSLSQLPDKDIRIISNKGNTFYGITENGLFKIGICDSKFSELTNKETQSQEEKNLIVFPNPNNGVFRVEANDGNSSPFQYSIINNLGEKVMEGIITENAAIDAKHLPEGLYILLINSNSLIKSKKIFIKK